jgi:D-alanine-D-alanine ligase
MKIGLTYNLRKNYLWRAEDPVDADAEFDSETTIEQLSKTLKELGHEVVDIGWGKRIIEVLKKEPVDIVFNIAEGFYGRSREAQVPAILEMLNIPYVFSDPLTTALCHDKYLAKQIVRCARIPTPKDAKITTLEELESINLDYPLFAKPVHEGSAKGVTTDSVIQDYLQLKSRVGFLLKTYRQPVLVEEYLSGEEFTVAVLGNGEESRVLGMMQVLIKDSSEKKVYTFRAKEEWRQRVEYVGVSSEMKSRIEKVALGAYRVLECRDASRVDIRCNAEGEPFFLEMNTIAGLSPNHSDLCIIANRVGMSYKDLIGSILEQALKRYGL